MAVQINNPVSFVVREFNILESNGTLDDKKKKQLLNDIVILAYKYVAAVAHQKASKWKIPFDDLYQEGMIGLMQAIRKYDAIQSEFTYYARTWILSRMRSYHLQNLKAFNLNKSQWQRALYSHLGTITPENMSEKLPVTKTVDLNKFRKEVEATIEMLYGTVHPYFEDAISVEEWDVSSKYLYEDTINNLQITLNSIIDESLDGREKLIIKGRYYDDPPLKFDDIGATLGVSKQRVEQLEKRALNKLKKCIEQYEWIIS